MLVINFSEITRDVRAVQRASWRLEIWEPESQVSLACTLTSMGSWPLLWVGETQLSQLRTGEM